MWAEVVDPEHVKKSIYSANSISQSLNAGEL